MGETPPPSPEELGIGKPDEQKEEPVVHRADVGFHTRIMELQNRGNQFLQALDGADSLSKWNEAKEALKATYGELFMLAEDGMREGFVQSIDRYPPDKNSMISTMKKLGWKEEAEEISKTRNEFVGQQIARDAFREHGYLLLTRHETEKGETPHFYREYFYLPPLKEK